MDASDLMREAEIRALGLVGHDMPDVLSHLVRVAAKVTGAAGARINVITARSQHTLVSAYGASEVSEARLSFCARIVREPARSHVVPDARLDDRFATNPFVTAGDVVGYAAQQLVTSNGVPIGTICVFDPEPMEVGEDAMDLLGELSAAVMDVLESRRHHDELEAAVAELATGSRELRRSNEHLAAFAGQVSHDVQGPLAAVLMALQMMEEEREETGEAAEAAEALLLDSALSGAQRMRATIAGLMDFAVLGGKLAVIPLDMNTVVADALVDLGARRGRARVEVADLPKAYGDDVQVRAVTQNLIANAMKYAGQRPVIRIGGDVLDGRTRITVSDDGPGVPLDQRADIFRLNVRGEGVELTGVDGLGIGLATCRRIIDAHGGSIGVGDSADGGAAFWFELPDPS